jgi:HEAT repeat protein
MAEDQGRNIIKKLTGKNPVDFEFVASHIINNSDSNSFSELVKQSDFLFDFIKKNVEKRLLKAVNETNYKNLFSFMKFYSSDYENFIVSTLVKFADEDLTDKMLELLENGTDEEKAYSAKYFSHINDTLAVEFLRKYSYSDFDPLAQNCAFALSAMKDEYSYNLAVEKLNSDDEFEKLAAIRFLSAFNDAKAIGLIFGAMKKSSMPENIACEISYLQNFLELLETDFKNDTILATNYAISGLGEIISLGQVFNFQLFEVLEKLITLHAEEKNPKSAAVLLNAKLKFDQLTENNEYLFDEDKNTKNEVSEIKNLLNFQQECFWSQQEELLVSELKESSDFIFSALELTQELKIEAATDKLKNLLNSTNQTVILKTIEVLKSLNKLDEINLEIVLNKISDANIKAIIQSQFKS